MEEKYRKRQQKKKQSVSNAVKDADNQRRDNEKENQIITKEKQTKIERSKGNRGYSERVNAK